MVRATAKKAAPTQSRAKRKRAGNQPDWILKMKARDPDDPTSARVGAAWTNSKGGISIRPNIGVVLNALDFTEGGGFILTLWPNDSDDETPF